LQIVKQRAKLNPMFTGTDLLAEFWRYQTRRGIAGSTQRTYGQYLEPFVAWMGDRDAGALSSRDIEIEWLGSWIHSSEARRGRAPSVRTIRNHIIALRAFFFFLWKFDYVDRNPVLVIDIPRAYGRKNDWLDESEDRALLSAAIRPVEAIVIPLLRWTGMRSGEAQSLRMKDVDLAEEVITVRHSKTIAGERTIPMFPPVRCEICRWLDFQSARGLESPQDFFLATRSGRPMSHSQLWVVVKRVAGRAGVRRRAPTGDHHNISSISPHTLRRTFASDLVNKGVRLEVVSRLLGHTDTKTTQECYAELLDQTVFTEARAVFS
jgi:integrase/recombinase XerD